MPRPKYPHLLPIDCEVWDLWLRTHQYQYESFDYDVRVGEGRDPGPEFPDYIRQMAIANSQRRIDAIGYAGNRIDLFEITHSAGLRAVGQCVTYPILYRQTYNPGLHTRMYLVAGRLHTDIEVVLRSLPIRFVVTGLPPGFEDPRTWHP